MRAWLNVPIIALVATCGCGSSSVLVESLPPAPPAEAFAPLPPPATPLPIRTPSLDFTPPSIGQGLGKDLSSALAEVESVAIVLPNDSRSAALEEKVFSMVKAASPSTAVLARGRATLDKLLEERGELPYRVTREVAGQDLFGRPIFVPKEHPLQTEWLSQKKLLKGARALLVVRPLRVDDQRLRALRDRQSGSCDQTLSDLHSDQETADKYFAPYFNPVNQALARSFSRHLRASLPFFAQELDRIVAQDETPGTARCAEAYRELLRAYEHCVDGNCALFPVAVAAEGGVVGLPDPQVFVPPTCPTAAMRDLKRELRDIAERATTEVIPSMDGPWAGELLRSAGVDSVAQALEDLCSPRHRRISQSDLNKARAAVGSFFNELSGQQIHGQWHPAEGQARASGKGVLTVLSRVRPQGADPRARAAELADQLRKLDLCTASPEQVYQAALIDVGTSEVVFMGLFFEEELLCPGLPPA